jgi:hypothetical protein
MFMSSHENAGQNNKINVYNKTLENVAKHKYMRMIVINYILGAEFMRS